MELLVHSLITVLALAVLYLSCPVLSLPSFGQLFAIFYVLFILVGAYFLTLSGWSESFDILNIANVGFLFFAIGCAIATWLHNFGPNDIAVFRRRPITTCSDSGAFNITAVIMLLIAALMATVFFQEGIALLSDDIDSERLQLSSGRGYLFVSITRMLPLLALIILTYALCRRSPFARFMFFLAIAATFIASVLSGYRAPLIAFVFQITLLVFYLRGRFAWRGTAIAAGAFLLIFGGVTLWKLRLEPNSIELLWNVFQHRLVEENARQLGFLIELFPNRFEFMWGGTYVMDLYSAMPGPGVGFGGWLLSETTSDVLYGLASLTPTLPGELYANFGFGGAMAGMLVFGYVLNLLYFRFIRGNKSGLLLPVWIVVAFSLANAAILGLGPTVVTRILVYLGVFAVFLIMYGAIAAVGSSFSTPLAARKTPDAT